MKVKMIYRLQTVYFHMTYNMRYLFFYTHFNFSISGKEFVLAQKIYDPCPLTGKLSVIQMCDELKKSTGWDF